MQDDLLGDAVEQLLAGHASPAVVRTIEGGGSSAGLWRAIEESGFCDALVPEAQGGAGLGLNDVFPVFEACGRHALAVPLAQTMAARALLARSGHMAAPGAIALASGRRAADSAIRVGYGSVADAVLVADGGSWLLLDASAARREAIEGTVDAELRWPAEALDKPLFSIPCDIDLRAVEACLLAAQLAGAMREVFTRTLQYANDRTQFGRSIGKFQAIQHQLSVMAEHTAAATMAARMACATSGITADPLACAVAKARTSEAAVPVAAIAHAVHGAIGITEEFDLQLLTRRLYAWRVAAGSESYWNERIGRALLASRHHSLPEFVRTQLCPTPNT